MGMFDWLFGKPKSKNTENPSPAAPITAIPGWTFRSAAEKCMGEVQTGSPGGAVDHARRFRAAVEHGVHDEQASLHAKYGDGKPDDPKENTMKCRLAAEEGDAESQFHLGVALSTGVGVSRDPKQGQDDAQFVLGCCYHLGEGIAQNPTEAVACYRAAAEQMSDLARFMLGACFAEGFGVTKDSEQALKFYKMASGGDSRARGSSRRQAIYKKLSS